MNLDIRGIVLPLNKDYHDRESEIEYNPHYGGTYTVAAGIFCDDDYRDDWHDIGSQALILVDYHDRESEIIYYPYFEGSYPSFNPTNNPAMIGLFCDDDWTDIGGVETGSSNR